MEVRSIYPLRVLVALLLGGASLGSAQFEIKAPRRAEVERATEAAKKVFDHLSPEQREALRQAFFHDPDWEPARPKTPSLADRLKEFSEPPLSLRPPILLSPQIHRPEVLGTAFRKLLEDSEPSIDWNNYLAGAFESGRPPDAAEIKTAQILLSQMGYYRARPDGIAGAQTSRAVQSFNSASGRWSDGSLNHSTITALFLAALKDYEHMAPEIRPEAEKQLNDCLAKIGFTDANGGVGSVIAKFETFIGLPQTGRIGPEVVSRVEDDLKLQDEVTPTLAMRFMGLTPEQFFSRRDDVFGFLGNDSQRFLLVRPNAPELWVLDDQGQVVRRVKGPAGVQEFYEAGRQIAAANSNDHDLFLYASPDGTNGNGTIALQIGREFTRVTQAEFNDFMHSGNGLSKLEEAIGTGERRTLFVLDSGIFRGTAEQSRSTDAEGTSAASLAAALRTRFRRVADVFLAKDARVARENAKKLLPITQPADLAVYTAPGVTDFGTIENLKRPLTRAGIRVVDEATGYREVPGTNFIIIMGHRDRPMSDQLQELKQTGVLKGKLVAVISCYAPGVEALQSGLMAGPQSAAGVLFYSRVINATAVVAVMREVARIVGSQEFSPSTLDKLLERGVDAALEKADTEFEKQEIEKMRTPIDQRSMLRRPGREPEA
jgi:peptidoglycan hydrolase-like protein with peptidoglycan-binding domain